MGAVPTRGVAVRPLLLVVVLALLPAAVHGQCGLAVCYVSAWRCAQRATEGSDRLCVAMG
jgi:hypothetical protein